MERIVKIISAVDFNIRLFGLHFNRNIMVKNGRQFTFRAFNFHRAVRHLHRHTFRNRNGLLANS